MDGSPMPPADAVKAAIAGKVAAVVVTYFPDSGFRQRLESLLDQIDRVVIIDNGSDAATLGWSLEMQVRPDVSVERNLSNIGIAAALNRGMSRLADEGYAWVLTLDQDSTVRPGCIAALLATLARDGSPSEIAMVGSNRRETAADAPPHRWLKPKRGFPFFERATADRTGADGVTLVITSGTLTSTAAFRRLGPFRTDFFIDLVDSEYCLRARRGGFRILVSAEAQLLHRVGAKQPAMLLGIPLTPMHHAALRKYYIFRNAVAVMRGHGGRFPHWLLYQLLALGEVFLGILFFERDKRAKMRACWAGVWDGLNGRMGPARRRF